MGELIDALSLVVGGGLSATQLAVAIAQWRRSRHAAPVVMITKIDSESKTVRIEDDNRNALEQAARELEEP
jgi:hypothetical protein